MYKYPKYVSTVNDIPNKPFLAILKEESVYIPGDERSQTNPGHGYPASTQNYFSMEVYDTEEEWKKAIKEYELRKTKYKAISMSPASVRTNVEVDVNVS